MASDMGSVRGRVGERASSSRTPVAEKIVPNSGWTEDSEGHHLLVDVPGFEKEEVKLEVDDSGHIIVKGERITSQQKRVHFELIFPMPMDSDMDNIAANFDNEILYVYVPKLVSQVNKESEIEEAANGNVERPEEIRVEEPFNADNEGRDNPSQHDREKEKELRKKNENARMQGFSEGIMRKREREPSMSRSAVVEVLRRNKGIVITAVIAFFFGLYVSHKLQSLAAP